VYLTDNQLIIAALATARLLAGAAGAVFHPGRTRYGRQVESGVMILLALRHDPFVSYLLPVVHSFFVRSRT